MSQSPHDEFVALCALSTSGEVTGEEQKRLQAHLKLCPSCREVMKQYEAVVSNTIPASAPDPENLESDPSWSQEQAEAAFFQRLTLEEELGTDREGSDEGSASKIFGRVPLSASQATWRNVWTLCAAGVLLCIALGISAYRVGIRRGTESTSVSPARDQANQMALQQQLSDAGREREVLRSQMAQRDQTVSNLRRQLEQQSAEMGRMRLAENQMEANLQNGQAGRQNVLQEQSDLNQKLETAQAKTQSLQDELASLERQASEDKQRASAMEAKDRDLARLLSERDATIDQQQELLAHDRDIRDLMGARDLYVAEVYDVERNGRTNKAYGRVFYTKGKSLIFYAYDLDQAGIKNASTFQAWGRRGPDWQQALNLGVFYVDNASKKRWVLRFDDPKALAQIDAVFVTVEPNGGSPRPSSNKPLLFAYLHIDPNHP